MRSELIVVSNRTGKKIADQICKDFELDNDVLEIMRFNDTEILPKFKKSVRNADVFYICPFYPDPKGRLVETMLVEDALRCSVPERKIAIPTYLGFMRSDKPEGRTSINVRKVAETFENWNYVASFHIHNIGSYAAFRCPIDSFLPMREYKRYVEEYMKERGLDKNEIVIVAPDFGRAAYAEKFANEVGADKIAIIYKIRPTPGEARALHLLGDVKGKSCIIVDDIIDTGGTLIEAADICKNNGAKDVIAIMTHGIFSKKIRPANKNEEPSETIYIETFEYDDLKEELQRAMYHIGFEPKTYRVIAEDTKEERLYTLEPTEHRIRKSVIDKVVTTDTIPRSNWYLEQNKDWLTQITIIPTIEEIIDRVHHRKPIHPLIKQ